MLGQSLSGGIVGAGGFSPLYQIWWTPVDPARAEACILANRWSSLVDVRNSLVLPGPEPSAGNFLGQAFLSALRLVPVFQLGPQLFERPVQAPAEIYIEVLVRH